jgi:hypothetical protein
VTGYEPRTNARTRTELMDWWFADLCAVVRGIMREARMRTTEPEFVHSEEWSGRGHTRGGGIRL